MKKFRLSAEAAGDLTEIFDYIAEDNIAAAQRVRAGIHDQAVYQILETKIRIVACRYHY